MAGVSSSYYPSVGGVERYVHLGMEAIAEWADVQLLVADRNRRIVGAPPPSPLPVEYLPSRTVFGERLILPGALFAALRRFRPDLIWTQHPSLTGDLAGWYARAHGLPWVATYHADLAPWRPYGRPYSRWEGWALARSSAVMVSSPRYRRTLVARGIAGERVRVVPLCAWIGNGTPPEPRATAVPPGGTFGPEHPFLFVGGLDRQRAYKRPERLLEAIAHLRARGLPAAAWFVGDGDRRAELEGIAGALGLGSAVTFLGTLRDAELADRYRRAWAFVLPSDNAVEGYGTVCMEAIQYGCPVVTSDVVPAGDPLRAVGAALVYGAGDPAGLETALATMMAAPSRRAEMSAAALRVAPEYTWPRVRPQLVAPMRESTLPASAS